MKLTWLQVFWFSGMMQLLFLIQVTAETNTALFNKLRQPAIKLDQGEMSMQLVAQLSAAEVDSEAVYVDPLTQRFSTLLPAVELVNPQVINNGTPEEQTEWIKQSVMQWLIAHQDLLQVKPEEVSLTIGKAGNDQFNVYGQRLFHGIPVRLASLTATVKHGRLMLFGMQNWFDIEVLVEPTKLSHDVESMVRSDVTSSDQEIITHTELVIYPGLVQSKVQPTLAWEVTLKSIDGSTHEVVVINDRSGAVMNVTDVVRSVSNIRNVNGGVYPFTNDGIGPLGVEYSRYPMPFAFVSHDQGNSTTNMGGNVFGVKGHIQTELKGPYVEIVDDCGQLNESSAVGELNLGVSAGTDCATPAGTSPGNTHAARTAFYQINHIMAGTRTVLTTNSWLTQPLTVQVNLMNNQCNAIWNGDDILAYVSSAFCANLGELAGVLFHEFTHGLDDHGTNPGTTFPNEGITDLMAALKTNQSCPARGAFPGSQCAGFGDACLDCDGTVDVDWAKHASGIPHDLSWVDANCSAFDEYCQGVPVAEALWDLYQRDLPGTAAMDSLTARHLTTQWTLAAADIVGNWYNLSGGSGDGCNADGGYLNVLAADDDNGDLSDGTPHMQAIYNAFNRHGMACPTPIVTNSGCNNVPVTSPQLSFNTIKNTDSVSIEWADITAANSYAVYRGEGVQGCDSMMNLVATTPESSYLESGLQIGRSYHFSVNGLGTNSSCYGPSSPCLTVMISDVIFQDGFE